jgi:putative transposase
MSSTLQSGVRFQALPTPEMRVHLSQWIGCQRVIYNAKVSEDQLFAKQRRIAAECGISNFNPKFVKALP